MLINVLHILTSFEVGGAEMVALEVLRSLDRERFSVGVCSLGGPGPMQERFAAAGVQTDWLRRSPYLPGYDASLAVGLARLLRRRRVQVVHTHNSFATIYGATAARLAGVPAVVCTQHAVGSNGTSTPSILQRAARGCVTHFVTVSEFVRRAAVRKGYVQSARTSVVYNGVDISRFARHERVAEPRERLIVGSVGRLSHEKGYDVLIEAYAEIAPDAPDTELWLVGDGAERPVLKDQARGLGLEGRVRFFGLRDDVPELLIQMDLFVLPSRTEGLPVAVLEAMACGLAVVATEVGGVPEVVAADRTGLLVSPEEPDALAGAMERLVGDAELRADMGRKGRKTVAERFSLKAAARQHEALYERLLKEKGVRLESDRVRSE